MLFTIFHHDDLDGYFSAVLAKILFCPDKTTRFEQLTYGENLEEIISEAAQTSCVIVVDLPPHPDAVVCVDHHRSSSDLVEQLHMMGDAPVIYFDAGAPSAAQILFDTWQKKLINLKPLVDEVSKIDSASYKDIDEAVANRTSLQFAFALENLSGDERSEVLNTLAGRVQHLNFGIDITSDWTQLMMIQKSEMFNLMLNFSEQYYQEQQEKYSYCEQHADLYKNWIVLECDDDKCFHRYGLYKLFPTAFGYVVVEPTVKQKHIRLGLNCFWKENPALDVVHLGYISARCAKGGGGHKRAAGFEKEEFNLDDIKRLIDSQLSPLLQAKLI